MKVDCCNWVASWIVPEPEQVTGKYQNLGKSDRIQAKEPEMKDLELDREKELKTRLTQEWWMDILSGFLFPKKTCFSTTFLFQSFDLFLLPKYSQNISKKFPKYFQNIPRLFPIRLK